MERGRARVVRRIAAIAVACGAMLAGSRARAQSAGGNDAPSVRVGATLYADYTYVQQPKATDADGNSISSNAFNITRSYININGTLSHVVAFRITPDVTRDTSAGSSLNGSLVFRVKYAFAQVNLDDWTTRGTWVRLGIQQTPWLDYAEGIYRYRFQGTMFVEREGYFASADGGASFHYNLPDDRGDLHVGIYNGENYNKAEVNNEKAFMIRGTVRPFASDAGALRGVRAAVFYDADAYVRNGPRRRFIGSVSFEHPRLNAAFEYLATTDQVSSTARRVDGRGFSIWATPRSTAGWEGLLRYDHLKPDTGLGDETRSRTILGLAYWFPMQGGVSSALMLDYDGRSVRHVTPTAPKDRRIALHALVNF